MPAGEWKITDSSLVKEKYKCKMREENERSQIVGIDLGTKMPNPDLASPQTQIPVANHLWDSATSLPEMAANIQTGDVIHYE